MPAAYGKETRDALCDAYRRLGSAPKAAEAVGASSTWAYRVLKERGVWERAQPVYPPGLAERACALYVEEGLSLAAACERVGELFEVEAPSKSWLRRQMDERGLDRRDGGYERHEERTLQYNGRTLRLRGEHGPALMRRVLEGYEAGRSPRELAEAYGVPEQTIQHQTERAGIRLSPAESWAQRQAQRGEISHVAGARIAERLYAEEVPVRRIAERLGRRRSTVYAYLRKRGVALRSQSEASIAAAWGSQEAYRAFCRDAARLVHDEGWTQQAVAEKHGVNAGTVRRALDSEHNPFRGQGGAGRAWMWEGHYDKPSASSRAPRRRPSRRDAGDA